MTAAILTGLIAGIIHVVSGPDHMAAVAPFAVEDRKKSWLVGLEWGVGHTGGVWIIGILALMFREALPMELLSSWSERLVGVILIGIGIWGVRRAMTTRVHYHEHTHDGELHTHFHFHKAETEGAHEKKTHSHAHAPLGIGALHGLAGSSHLFGVLPALMLPTRLAAMSYVIAYGLGSIAAMSIFAWLIGNVVYKLMKKSVLAYNWTLGFFAATAIGVGIFWLTIT